MRYIIDITDPRLSFEAAIRFLAESGWKVIGALGGYNVYEAFGRDVAHPAQHFLIEGVRPTKADLAPMLIDPIVGIHDAEGNTIANDMRVTRRYGAVEWPHNRSHVDEV